ncbi:MAG: DUF488 domain-containing protein [Candidatus Aureabacteria bacterium]|nr:DUF488 domain-containing protein [Candidatus Auribacterota bacterium]
MARVNVLYTIGYEGKDLDAFVSQLGRFQIQRVVDVREVPLSRKRGFSKSPLRERLGEEGFEYVHLKELGSPKEIRKKLKEDNDYRSFFQAFSTYLNSNKLAIEEVYQYVLDATCCLMCFEQSPEECHRSIVAQKIKERDGNGLTIVNI